MKNLTNKLTIPFLATVLVAALSGVIQITHADSQLVSAASDDNELNLKEGPPHSIAFSTSNVINPNGTRNFEVNVMNPDGTEQTRATFDERLDLQPDISPDGRQIVWASSRITETNPEGDLEIFLMDADGRNVTQLTFNGAGINDQWPRWSPNGRQIAFHSNVDGNVEIYLINSDGTDLTRVTEYSGIDAFPEWSPNGKQLGIRRDTDIYVIDTDGGNPIRLTNETPLNQMASWSPNGQRIAFMSFRDGYCSVYVMYSDGSYPTNLTPKPATVPNNQFCSRAPAWSRNGQQIYFSSLRPETDFFENIFVMNADGGDVTRLTFDSSTGSIAAVR